MADWANMFDLGACMVEVWTSYPSSYAPDKVFGQVMAKGDSGTTSDDQTIAVDANGAVTLSGGGTGYYTVVVTPQYDVSGYIGMRASQIQAATYAANLTGYADGTNDDGEVFYSSIVETLDMSSAPVRTLVGLEATGGG